MKLVDPRNGRGFDLPPDPQNRAYVLASSPRTGSTLLARILWGHGGAGAPKEYLNPMQLRDWEVRFGSPVSRLGHRLLRGPLVGLAGRVNWSPARVEQHLHRVRTRRSSGGWFGMKLHAHHLRRMLATDLEEILGPTRFIRVRRRDPVAQAVSWELAQQTHQWVASQTPLWNPVYVRHRLAMRLAAVEEADQVWNAVLAGRTHQTVWFEDLVERPLEVARSVLDGLGVVPGPMPTIPLDPMNRVEQGVWVERYRRES